MTELKVHTKSIVPC